MGCVSVVSIILRVVSISIPVVIDWVYIHLVGVVVLRAVLNVVDIMVFNMVFDWVAVIVHVVVSRLCYIGSRVVVVVGSGDVWLNMVVLSVLVLGGVSGFVVLSWASVGMDWLGVGVLVNIHDWVVVLIMRMVRVTSWVGVDSLIIVVDGLVVDWLNLVGSEALEIVTDSFVWCVNIVCSHVVVVMIIVMSMSSVVVVDILELNLMVVLIVMVGSVINFVLGLMVNKLMGDIVVLSLTSLNMWLNLVNASLLKRSVV